MAKSRYEGRHGVKHPAQVAADEIAVKIKRTEVPAEFRQNVEPEATEAQMKYIRDLLDSRALTDEELTKAAKRMAKGLSKKLASEWIDILRVKPKRQSDFGKTQRVLPDVPDGRFAVMVSETVAGEDVETLKFFKVKKPTEGRWAGFVFLDAGRGGGHGDLQWTPVKNLDYKFDILKLIAADPRAAGQKFGQEVGACYRCGRSLTDATSRELGIGPDCREMEGY